MPVAQTTTDVAREYARAGYRVLPLYGLVYNEETGERECACKDRGDCKSPGKHPYEKVAPRGAHDATADVNAIDAWPEHCNLGIVPPPTTAGIDIDDSDLAQKILEMDDIQEMCVARTRRGIHLYVRCLPAQTQNLKAADGHHVGEIRVDNALLVLPPSRHLTGEYAWIGRSLLTGVPETAGTAFDYIASILARVGVSLVERIDPEILAQQPSKIVEQDLPFVVDPNMHLVLYQMLTGTYPTPDRSKILYQLGCEMYRAAAELGIDLPPEVAAGVIRKADSVAWRKFADRADRDVRYWETAVKTQAEIAAEIAMNGKASSPSRAGTATFAWDPVAGFTYMGGGQNPTPRRVCNFEPLIVEVQDVIGEEGDIRSDWFVRFTNVDGDVFETKLRERERAELRKCLSGILPPTFIVSSREWGNFDEGMRWYSKDKLRYRRVYGETGWLPERDAFLLPATGGAITAAGIDTTIELANDVVTSSPLLRQYGVGMVTPEPGFDPAEALRALYNMAPPQITIPLVIQAVAAPLTSLDTSKTAAILHMFSRTGSFKTSMARVVIGLYGAFDNSPLDSWTSTANSLQGMMHEYRDLPMIVDDYKRSLGRSHLQQMIALIQTYADRTARGRMTRDQRQQRKVYPRCLVISTGEDVWEGQESVMARTIVLDASYGATSGPLSKAQQAARSGALARVGYMWIEWLCQRGREQVTHDLEAARVTMTANLEHLRTAEHHARSRASLASMLAVDTLWRQFIAERVAGFVDEYRTFRTDGWREILDYVSAQAEDAQSYSPYETVRTAIINGLMTGQAQLAPRLRGYVGVGSQLAEVIGYVDDQWVWLNEGITLGWFARGQHRQGADAVVSWPSLLQEGRRDHGMHRPVAPQRVMHQNQAIGMRLVGFPREDFLGDELVAQIGVAVEPTDLDVDSGS